MEFLKKDVFYPSDGKYDDKLIKSLWVKYDVYLEEIKSKLPKNLYTLYISNNKFHDYVIKKVEILGNVQCYGTKSDKVLLELDYEEKEIILEFDQVSFLKLLVDSKDSCWVSVAQEPCSEELTCGLEELLLCELCMISDKVYKFEFLSSSGAVFEIHFSKIKTVKRIKKY